MKVLLVADNPSTREAVEECLIARGYQARVNSDARAAWASFQREPCPLIVMDLLLPGRDAPAFCRRIRASAGGDTPVILVLADGDGATEAVAEILAAGADDFYSGSLDTHAISLRFQIAESRVRDRLELRRLREAEEPERAREARVQALLESAPDPLVAVDRRGDITMVTAQTEWVFGYAREELIGQPIELLIAERFRAEHIAHRASFSSDPRTRMMGFGRDLTGRRKDGSEFPVEITLGPLGPEDDASTMAIIRDVTARKAMEQTIKSREDHQRQAQKMEAIGLLTGGIAHDFNNLLTIIVGFSDLVLAAIPPDHALTRYMREIRAAGDRATIRTRQLLAFGRRQILQPQILDLNTVVVGAAERLSQILGPNVQVATRLEPNLASVLADPGQMSQVLVDLASNARDAMPNGGLFSIKTANVVLGESYLREHGHRAQGITQPGRFIMLAVEDTGQGMDAETQRRIFEPFFTTKDPVGGSGLGLSTVYGIVKQSDGDIWVESEPGRGTKLSIYLPPATPPLPGPIAETGPRTYRGSETLLIVEDEAAVRGLVAAALQSAGYAVLVARDGAEALEVIEHHDGPLDLLITDLVIPGINGRDLAQRVFVNWPALPVLYISGYTDDEMVRHGLLEANASFLQKPFTPTVLTKKVREVLDGPFWEPD